jgi:hypothetical protein
LNRTWKNQTGNETAATRWKIISYFAILNLALGLGSPAGIASIPIGYFLKDNLRLSPLGLAGFGAIAAAPVYVSFLFGFLRDRWRPSRSGDRGYLLGGGLGAVAAYLMRSGSRWAVQEFLL